MPFPSKWTTTLFLVAQANQKNQMFLSVYDEVVVLWFPMTCSFLCHIKRPGGPLHRRSVCVHPSDHRHGNVALGNKMRALRCFWHISTQIVRRMPTFKKTIGSLIGTASPTWILGFMENRRKSHTESGRLTGDQTSEVWENIWGGLQLQHKVDKHSTYSSVFVCAQPCLTLCNPLGYSPPDSFFHGIFQLWILEWVAISSSRGSSWPRDWNSISGIFCIGRQILYHCTTWEAQPLSKILAQFVSPSSKFFQYQTTSHLCCHSYGQGH